MIQNQKLKNVLVLLIFFIIVITVIIMNYRILVVSIVFLSIFKLWNVGTNQNKYHPPNCTVDSHCPICGYQYRVFYCFLRLFFS